MDWVKARLKEKSTWTAISSAIIAVAASFGIDISPELKESIMQAVVAISCVALVVAQEKA